MSFSARELALLCARVVDQKGGEDVLVLQLPATAHSFDYAVLVSAGSDRLTNALVEECWHFCKRHQIPRMPVEGESGWMLIDCYDVVVHALSQEKRDFYQLDTLWPLAKKVDWAKEVKALPDPDKKPSAAAKAVEAEEAEPVAAKKKTAKKAPKSKKKNEILVKDVEEVVEEAEEPEAEAAPKKKPAKKKAAAKAEPEPVEEPAVKQLKFKAATRAKKQQGEKNLDLASVPLPNPAKRPRR